MCLHCMTLACKLLVAAEIKQKMEIEKKSEGNLQQALLFFAPLSQGHMTRVGKNEHPDLSVASAYIAFTNLSLRI